MLIRKMTDGTPFAMGQGVLRNVFGPDSGARHLTFNYCQFDPGEAFTPHAHDRSEDLILVLTGGGVIRLGDEQHPIEPGDVSLVAEGELHGTVAGPEGMVCVSVQAPPDPKLYDGSRDVPGVEGTEVPGDA